MNEVVIAELVPLTQERTPVLQWFAPGEKKRRVLLFSRPQLLAFFHAITSPDEIFVRLNPVFEARPSAKQGLVTHRDGGFMLIVDVGREKSCLDEGADKE